MNRSFANGNGASVANGPGTPDWNRFRQGLDPRPVTSWALTIGQAPS